MRCATSALAFFQTHCAGALRRMVAAILGLVISILVIVSAPVLAAPSPPREVRSLEASDLEPWIDGYVGHALHSGDIAGAVVVVVKDGRIVTARGYGWADIAARRMVDPGSTLFRVGSLSKLFTWTAVMQQVEAGRLDLDRDVNASLDFKIPPFEGRPVTLRQIMTHTAGFEETGKNVITFHPPMPLETYIKRWIPTRIYPPGTTPAYSNWGAALAGYVVQRVSQTPFPDYAERQIFVPLGMLHSTFKQPLPPSLAPFMAQGYPRASVAPQPFEIIGPSPAGALSASGLDMARFMIAHLNGGRGLMSPQAAALMHDSPLDRVDPKSLIPPLNRAELGFLEHKLNGQEVIGHRGATQNFHTLLELYVNEHVGLFASFNSAGRDGAAEQTLDQLSEAFADRYFPGPPATARVPPDLARAHARMMVGQWQGSRRADDDFLALASLFGQTSVGLTADGHLSIPSLKDEGGAAQRWEEIAPFVWQSASGHERLAAQVVNGKAVRWSTDTLAPAQVFDRVPVARSAAWLLPALLISLGSLLLTVLYWPAAWLVRRRYKTPIGVRGAALNAYRAIRLSSLLDLVILCGWIALLARMLSDLDWFSKRSDTWLRLLEAGGAIAFVGSVGIAVWNCLLTWKDGRGWTRKAWSIVIVLSTITLLYTAYTFGLLAMTVNY